MLRNKDLSELDQKTASIIYIAQESPNKEKGNYIIVNDENYVAGQDQIEILLIAMTQYATSDARKSNKYWSSKNITVKEKVNQKVGDL